MNGKLFHFLVRTSVYLILVRTAAYLMIAAVIQHARSSQFADIPSAEQATLSGSSREKPGGGQTVAKETVSVIHPEKSGMIPENTLLFRRERPAVGVALPDRKVELPNITMQRETP